jgi:hypothetical protein
VANESELEKLARALRELHRALVERARSDYLRENLIGGDIGPGELLRLLTTDPYFEWLRSLSELMVDIDLVRDRDAKEERAEASDTVRGAVEYLLTPPAASAAPHAFAQRYWPYVHDDPRVAMAHADVKRALSAWPAPEHASSENLLKERSALAERARKRD